MNIGRLELSWDGLEWDDWYYVYWWNWLSRKNRYWGREDMFYDGPHHSFGFWWFNVSWRMPWSKWPE